MLTQTEESVHLGSHREGHQGWAGSASPGSLQAPPWGDRTWRPWVLSVSPENVLRWALVLSLRLHPVRPHFSACLVGGQRAQCPAAVAARPLPRSSHAKPSCLGLGTQGHSPFPRANVCLPDQMARPCGLQLKATGLLRGAPGRERMQTGPSLGLAGPEHT